MHRGLSGATAGLVLAFLSSLAVACADPGSAVGPAVSASSANAVASRGGGGGSQRQVSMLDACDGPSFNAAVGPGTCASNHGVNFAMFVADLTRNQSIGAWHFAPSQMDAKVGETLVALNMGGEVHSFTRVANFGGGIVRFLNQLSGNPNTVPECAAETMYESPGGTDTEVLSAPGTVKFQCCIHPWMRTTVSVNGN